MPTTPRKSGKVFDGRRITGVFQPHLYSRTRDFYKDFAASLSLLDEVLLCDIYPARELPIEGVSSKIIFDEIKPDVKKRMVHKEDLAGIVKDEDFDVLVILGAGDIDVFTPKLAEITKQKDN